MVSNISGTDAIRAATQNHAKRDGGLQRLGRDLNLSLTMLDEFVYHGGHLPSEALRLLATSLFAGMAEFDADLNLLRATNRAEPIAMGVRAPQFVPPPIDRTIRGPSVGKGAPALPPARPQRPGWAD